MTAMSFNDRLLDSPVYKDFRSHPFFSAVDTADFTKQQAEILIQQWWHPLHYFPTFLARSIAVLPDIASKTAITRILNQEVGNGIASHAHEVIYIDSMKKSGFDGDAISNAVPYVETSELVAGYHDASAVRESALGFIFATETTDLLMVSSIGTAIKRTTGIVDNKWVSIHVEQEPDHVEEAGHALLADFDADQERSILAKADEMWKLWTSFFDRLAIESELSQNKSAT